MQMAYTPTAAHRKKLSQALKGRQVSAEHRAAISAANKGRKRGPFTEQHRARIAEALKRHKRTKAHARNISKALKGKPGHPQSKASREKNAVSVARAFVEGRSKVGIKGWFTGKKTGGAVSYRSPLELLWYRHLEEDPKVVSIRVEPLAIPYTMNGLLKNYVPDLKVTRQGRIHELIEIKVARERSYVSPTDKLKWQAAHEWCAKQSHPITFRVVYGPP